MKRNINVPVVGNVYRFDNRTEEQEENIRKAAKSLDAMAKEIHANRPETTDAELGRVLALNKGIEAEQLKKEIERLKKEIQRLHTDIEGLHKELESYLDRIV